MASSVLMCAEVWRDVMPVEPDHRVPSARFKPTRQLNVLHLISSGSMRSDVQCRFASRTQRGLFKPAVDSIDPAAMGDNRSAC
jgi:hypothetical protein